MSWFLKIFFRHKQSGTLHHLRYNASPAFQTSKLKMRQTEQNKKPFSFRKTFKTISEKSPKTQPSVINKFILFTERPTN